jgi:hypothetical protein
MIGVEVTTIKRGMLPQQFSTKINNKVLAIVQGIEALGYEAETRMKDYIDENRKRPKKQTGQPTLRQAIQTDILENGVGIGHVPTLDVDTPYWYILNYGGHLPANRTKTQFVPGFFGRGSPPIEGAGGELFTYAPYNNIGFRIKPDSIITGIGYITKTKNWVKQIMKPFLTKYVR